MEAEDVKVLSNQIGSTCPFVILGIDATAKRNKIDSAFFKLCQTHGNTIPDAIRRLENFTQKKAFTAFKAAHQCSAECTDGLKIKKKETKQKDGKKKVPDPTQPTLEERALNGDMEAVKEIIAALEKMRQNAANTAEQVEKTNLHARQLEDERDHHKFRREETLKLVEQLEGRIKVLETSLEEKTADHTTALTDLATEKKRVALLDKDKKGVQKELTAEKKRTEKLGIDKLALSEQISALRSEKTADQEQLSSTTAKALADLVAANAALESEKQAHQATKNSSAELEKARDEELVQTQNELEEAKSAIANLRAEVALLQQTPQQVASTSAAAVIPTQPTTTNPPQHALVVNPPPPEPVRPLGHPPVKDVDDDYEKYNNQRNRDKKKLAGFGADSLNATVKKRKKLLKDIETFKSKCQAKLDSGTLTPWMAYERAKTMLAIWRIETNLEAQIQNQQAQLEEEAAVRMPARKKPKQ